jgi:excisionase family DNA binding protein
MSKTQEATTTAPTISPRLLRIAEAAIYLGATVWAVRQLIWNKEIPYVRVGKRQVIDRADLDKWIDRQRALSRGAAA